MRTKVIDAITLTLVILGGLNWLLVGVFDFDVITTVLDAGPVDTDIPSAAARIVYVLIGLAAIWQMFALFRVILLPEPREPSA